MCGTKVLIVLDDVSHINQLEVLAGECSRFKPGNRIMNTRRDEKLLLAHKVTLIRDVNLLSGKEAICIFSRYAFRREIPIEDNEEISKQVLCYASGLPLTIKVLGSNLCGEDKPIWNDTLQRLKTIPLTETMKILELSYTILEDDHKEIFLDIACIMKGWLKEKTIQALESCGFHALSGLRFLQQKSLITIDARWDQSLGKMKALRYLSVVTTNHLRDAELDTFSPSFPDALRYLKWDSYRFRSLPETFQANNLVTLELPTSEIVQLWEGGEKKDDIWKLEHLKSLDLWAWLSLKNLLEDFQRVGCLENLNLFSDSISMPKNLKYIRLAHCDEFEKLPEDLGLLECLEVLDLTNTKDLSGLESLKDLDLSCTDIEHIPDSICELKHLESLNINCCSRLEKLPEDLGQLECLRLLDLSHTYIKHLPDSIVMLKNLHKLDLDQCFSLEKLPEDLGQLESLEHITLSSTKMQYLPDSICMLKHLKSLNLACCWSLEKLPEEIGCLECLEDLSIGATPISYLPQSILMLKCLCVYGSRGSLEVSDEIQISYYDDNHVFNRDLQYDYVAYHKCYYDYDYTYEYDYAYDYHYDYTYDDDHDYD
ncbi:unnamed protein product [Lactuca saligna]|uniref:NB-ARC domain-containing protein n=1 Tax=Lactuca saligna TaxID=75948 RepID=A0AA36A2Q3_LACSI|nr:unnamed protein product [Lactuca saligna]